MSEEKLATVKLSCGRYYLEVAGIAVAMEGDKCREAEISDDLHDPIPEEELANASIGGKPAREMPLDLVRFFRGSVWKKAMLDWVATRINGPTRRPRAEMITITDEELRRLIDSLKRVLEGFGGVEPGQVSVLPLQIALQDISEVIGGEVQELATQIEEAYYRLVHPLASPPPRASEESRDD